MNKNKSNKLNKSNKSNSRIRIGKNIGYNFLKKITKNLPPDLHPKKVHFDPRKVVPGTMFMKPGSEKAKQYERDIILKRILENSDTQVATLVVTRGMIGRNISIGTTPVRVIQSQFLRGYIITNVTPSVGLTTTGTILGSALRAASSSGTTQTNPTGVASYREMKLFLNISASGTGVVNVDAQTKDPLSGTWITTQSDIFSSPSAVGGYYADLGSLGVDSDFAVSWSVSSAGSSTFSIGYILKDGLSGSSAGLSNTIYLGGMGVTSTAGYPLSEGSDLKLFFAPNAELWAVSNIPSGINLRIFEL